MRRLIAGAFLLTAMSVGFADTPAVTTQPTSSELEDLRVQVKALQQENDLLRSTLAAAGKATPPPATSDDKPLGGIEALLQEFPTNEMPGGDDGTMELRHSLLLKWIQNHAVGRTITLHGRFVSASGISNNTFGVKINSGGTAAHAFEATMLLPELEAPAIVDFRRGGPVEATGQIGDATVTWGGQGDFAMTITLVHATIKPDGSQPPEVGTLGHQGKHKR